jgi:GMP synthase (glutamine-hydrolysing)
MSDRILILDFGSQYTQLIARRIRELQVYSEIVAFNTPASVVASLRPAGIILSGGPASVYAEGAPQPDPRIFTLGIPILGICYGLQLMGKYLGGSVRKSEKREYGRGEIEVLRTCDLFARLPKKLEIWNSHGDHLTKLPKGFVTVAKTTNAPYAAIADEKRRLYGLQFHPEVVHTPRGKEILANFVKKICHARPTWTMQSFIDQACEQVRAMVGKV